MGFTAPVFGLLVLRALHPEAPEIKPLDGHFLPPTTLMAPFIMFALSKVMVLQYVSILEQVGGGIAGILAAAGNVETRTALYLLIWTLHCNSSLL